MDGKKLFLIIFLSHRMEKNGLALTSLPTSFV